MTSKIETPESGQVWQHYKGSYYVIVGLAIDGCTDRFSVVYKRQQHPGDDLFVRDLGDWLASVDWNGVKRQRFIRIIAD